MTKVIMTKQRRMQVGLITKEKGTIPLWSASWLNKKEKLRANMYDGFTF